MESDDYNQDGSCTTQDIVDAVAAYTPAFASIIHAVAPVTTTHPVRVIESNNDKGIIIRGKAENTMVTGDNLVVTNHFRVLYSPENEPLANRTRYANITDSLTVDSTMSCQRSWDLLTGAAGNSWSLYQVQFVPLTGGIKWRTAVGVLGTTYQPAPTQPVTETSLTELFNY